jgi:NADPH:quinone reductase
MAKGVELVRPGGPGQLRIVEIDVRSPGRGEVLVRQTAIALNFVDIYHREGSYPLPQYPVVLGVEAAGVVEEIGPEVTGFARDDRVVYAGLPVGAYAAARVMPAERLVKLSDAISTEVASAGFLRGLTARMLLSHTYRVRKDDWVLVRGAAGGLGTILGLWAKKLGAFVIGTVGSTQKAKSVFPHAVDLLLVGRDTDVSEHVFDLAEGRGIDVAYDGVGGLSLMQSARCLRCGGTLINIGRASGSAEPSFLHELLAERGIAMLKPSIISHIADLTNYREAAGAYLDVLRSGVQPRIGKVYPLADVAFAHSELETGNTIGSSVLIP